MEEIIPTKAPNASAQPQARRMPHGFFIWSLKAAWKNFRSKIWNLRCFA